MPKSRWAPKITNIPEERCSFGIVLLNDDHIFRHPNMTIMDQIFGESFQHLQIIREAYSFFAIVLDALLKVG